MNDRVIRDGLRAFEHFAIGFAAVVAAVILFFVFVTAA